MEIITVGRKGQYLNTLEKYHIYKVSRKNLHINDASIDDLRNYTEYIQNNITYPLPCPTPPFTLHMHNV
jgi:hypothetical protein